MKTRKILAVMVGLALAAGFAPSPAGAAGKATAKTMLTGDCFDGKMLEGTDEDNCQIMVSVTPKNKNVSAVLEVAYDEEDPEWEEFDSGKTKYNASAQRAVDIGDSIKRIDGTEVPLTTPWLGQTAAKKPAASKAAAKTTSKAEAKPAAKAEKAPAKAAAEAAPAAAGSKPAALSAPKGGVADDLKMIKGVGPKLEKLLNSLGFYHFEQVAAWTADELAWVDQNIEGFKGRATRDAWVSQAKVLMTGVETEFSKRAKKDGVYE